MLNYKKPAFWIIVVAVVACIVVAVCFLTNPIDTAIGKPVFETENIARVIFYSSAPNSEETEVPSEYLAEITEWLGTFVAGKKAEDVLPPGADSLFVRIEYADGSINENSMSTTIVDGTTYIINYDKEPQCYFDLFTAYRDFETAIAGMDNKENIQVFDVYPMLDDDIVLAGFTTGSDLSFATFEKSGNINKIRGFREFGRVNGLNSMTIMKEQGIDQSLTVALSSREDLARVTAQYGDTILEKMVDCCPAMIVFEWKEILPEDATVVVRFYNAENKELERMDAENDAKGKNQVTDHLDTGIDVLREKYPEYFDLSTAKGLEVYVWQMAQNSYSFGVLSGTNRYKSPEELWNLKGVSAEEMKAILSTYDMDEQNIYIYPWQNPISSYIAEYWITQEGEEQSSVEARRQAYVDNIRLMLFD